VSDGVRNQAAETRIHEIKRSLATGLAKVDPYHRLRDRPVRFQMTAGQTLEIAFDDVPSIGDTEINGVKKLLGGKSFCSVSPRSRERLTVRFVLSLER
jgi:hypothetical protein